MRSDLKKWFLEKYPNSSDYVKFFLENDHIFSYDCISGDVKLISCISEYVKPNYLCDLEMRVTNGNLSLQQMSKRLSEMEFFLKTFRLFVDCYETNKTTQISVQQLVELFNDQKYSQINDQISNMSQKNIGFDEKVVEYLRLNYETVFFVDEQNMISLKKPIIENINRVKKEIDDSLYLMFKALVMKYLRCNGGKDVNEMKESIAKKHHFIIDYMFGRQEGCDEYTFFDFVTSYSDDFVYKREVNSEGIVKRIINVKHNPKPEQKQSPQNNISFATNETQITNGSKNEGPIQSANHMYNEEESQQVANQVVTNREAVVAINDGPNQLIRCCVCERDNSNEYISYSDYREWAQKHKSCLLFKLIQSVKKEFDNRLKASTNKFDHKSVQTVSTGNVKPRLGVTSNDYLHY